MRFWRVLPVFFAFCLAAMAHVGNPNVVFEGKAGTSSLLVVIRQPDVVPGLADIAIRVESGSPESITVLPLHWNTDRSGAPRPDVATLLPGRTNVYAASLWLMTKGAYGVEVATTGPGGGSVVVPVNSIATNEKQMQKPLGFLLAFLGSMLVIGAISIAIGAARESSLEPGDTISPKNRRNGWIAGGIGTALCVTAIYSGRNWWNSLATEHHTAVVFHSLTNTVSIIETNRGSSIAFKINDSRARQRGAYALAPDHGKLIHLFLVGPENVAGQPALAHLHPVRSAEPWTFISTLPALPPGRYRMFADIAHESGLTQTLTNVVDIGAVSGRPDSGWSPSDTEDSFWLPKKDDELTMLGDGYGMRLRASAAAARMPVTLEASVTDSSGNPAQLQPYLRMLGHAVVVRSDGNVFSHLHPSGTFSLAAARRFAAKVGGETAARATDTVCGDLSALSSTEAAALGKDGKVSFPFVFPEPGRYWIWVQVRVGDAIRTGAMSVDATDIPPSS